LPLFFVEHGLYPRDVAAEFSQPLYVVDLLPAGGLQPQVEKRLFGFPRLVLKFLGRELSEFSGTH
jgi:hypothetical protein